MQPNDAVGGFDTFLEARAALKPGRNGSIFDFLKARAALKSPGVTDRAREAQARRLGLADEAACPEHAAHLLVDARFQVYERRAF